MLVSWIFLELVIILHVIREMIIINNVIIRPLTKLSRNFKTNKIPVTHVSTAHTQPWICFPPNQTAINFCQIFVSYIIFIILRLSFSMDDLIKTKV